MRFRKSTFSHGKPWLMEESALNALLVAASQQDASVEALARQQGKAIDGNYLATQYGGVAVIQVAGPLMRQDDFWSWLFGYGSYEAIAESISKAADDPTVTAIVLDVDSPGGEVTGCSDLSEMIYRMRGSKPIVAYATGDCCSAAYWIASACDRIIVSPTSRVGSIGCRASIRDYTQAESKIGIKTFDFVSSVSPYKAADPNTDDGAARIQATVDALGQVFVETVARNRGVSAKKVIQSYGQGDVMVGAAAVEAGLADGLGTLDDVLAEYGSAAEAAGKTGETGVAIIGAKTLNALRLLAKASEEDEKLKSKAVEDETEEDEDASEEEEDETAEEDDEEDASEDEDEPKAKVKAKGERGRIAAILNSPHAKGRSALAKHLALGTNVSAKEAIGILKAAPKASAAGKSKAKGGNEFAAAMGALGNPKVGVGKAKAATESEKGAAAIAEAARLIGLGQ